MADVFPAAAASPQRAAKDLLNLLVLRVPGLRPAEKNILGRELENTPLSSVKKGDIEFILKRPVDFGLLSMEKIRALAERDFTTARRGGISMISLSDREYPPLLREIYDPPAILFCRGVLPNPEKPLVAMVGTRRATSDAAAFAYRLGLDLGRHGVSVVSGLALGIDTFSHRGNIEAGAPAVAVLGSGLDQIYPASNRPLARRIIDSGGALLSEYAPEMEPRKWQFPARNRIISALARGTVIVEAPEKSGALITAAFVLEHGRDLWVASAGVNSPRGQGTAKLAADGAKVIGSAEDILAEWGLSPESPFTKPEPPEGTENSGAGQILAAAMARKLKIEI